jgi:hypothetical protein
MKGLCIGCGEVGGAHGGHAFAPGAVFEQEGGRPASSAFRNAAGVWRPVSTIKALRVRSQRQRQCWEDRGQQVRQTWPRRESATAASPLTSVGCRPRSSMTAPMTVIK